MAPAPSRVTEAEVTRSLPPPSDVAAWADVVAVVLLLLSVALLADDPQPATPVAASVRAALKARDVLMLTLSIDIREKIVAIEK